MMDEVFFPLAYLIRGERIEKNIRSLVQTCSGEIPATTPASLKTQFLRTVYRLSSSPIKVSDDDTLSILFEMDDAFEYYTSLYRSNFRTDLNAEITKNPYGETERVIIRDSIEKALSQIQKTMPDLFQALYYFWSRIYVFPSEVIFSSSKAHKCMGIIMVCPDDLNDVDFFVESIIHETLHQVICLEDSLHSIYEQSTYDEAKQYDQSGGVMEESTGPSLVGALSLKPRPFLVAFEALLISAVNQYFHLLSNHAKQADLLAENYAIALDKLNAFILHRTLEGAPPLTPNGNFWCQAMNSIQWKKIRELYVATSMAT